MWLHCILVYKELKLVQKLVVLALLKLIFSTYDC